MIQDIEEIPHWIWGRATCSAGDAPVCSKCGWAVTPEGTYQKEHEIECWAQAE